MGLTAAILADIQAMLVGVNDFATPGFGLKKTETINLLSGTGASQADKIFADRRTVANGANDDLDLAGVLLDPFGVAITFARIKALMIRNRAAIGSTLVLNVGAGSNPFISWLLATGDGVVVRPQGVLLLAAPDVTAYVVTATTGDILRVANPGASSVDFDIVIVGASA